MSTNRINDLNKCPGSLYYWTFRRIRVCAGNVDSIFSLGIIELNYPCTDSPVISHQARGVLLWKSSYTFAKIPRKSLRNPKKIPKSVKISKIPLNSWKFPKIRQNRAEIPKISIKFTKSHENPCENPKISLKILKILFQNQNFKVNLAGHLGR